LNARQIMRAIAAAKATSGKPRSSAIASECMRAFREA
jgi:hypothetical protein